MKIRASVLKRYIITEMARGSRTYPRNIRMFLKEASDEDKKTPDDMLAGQQETNDSIDAQVDKLLSNYEGAAKPKKEKSSANESRLFEAPGDEDEDKGDEDKKDDAEDEGGDDADLDTLLGADSEDEGEGEEEDEAPEPKKLTLDDIAIEQFTNDVARLIENADNLLEMRSTIAKRAVNFLLKSYDDNVIKTFKETLERNHSISTDQASANDDDAEAPAAIGAWGDGGGGGGAV